ncbi:MAG TPA: hypothetical protein VMG82_20560 [Candidatus Sulfotelmatobacter sp.]|nr:hypothetical protein [Candidatus Sulfotelmatobacter sp.]
MARLRSSRSTKRTHVVLIPGFAGFDALGQLEYYGGLTELFGKLRADNEVLHYFDNFPTAAVATRARLLREYLLKRVARGEISNDDDVTLIGHSTGGLDIRLLLWELCPLHEDVKPIMVDGRAPVVPADLIDRVRRVVFLSVPHWGTNIADWVRSHWLLRKAFIENLRATVAGSELSLLERMESAITANTFSITGAPVYEAVRDALDEANEDNGEDTEYRKAKAHDAASELALYLRHMASDFRAIDDLTSSAPGRSNARRGPMSPAHFNPEQRETELNQLRKTKIEFLSYATIGKRPFQFDPDSSAPLWELTNACTYPEVCKDAAMSARTDCMYRMCYRACAGGPFKPQNESRELAKRISPTQPVEVWDNDGIVNTFSMFWPLGKNVLVHADHMDIVGQFHRVPAESGGGRKSRTYDLLMSDSGFKKETFNDIWKDIFDFALGRGSAAKIFGAAA